MNMETTPLYLWLSIVGGPVTYWLIDKFKAWRKAKGEDVNPGLTTALAVIICMVLSLLLGKVVGLQPDITWQKAFEISALINGVAAATNGLVKWRQEAKTKADAAQG